MTSIIFKDFFIILIESLLHIKYYIRGELLKNCFLPTDDAGFNAAHGVTPGAAAFHLLLKLKHKAGDSRVNPVGGGLPTGSMRHLYEVWLL